MQSIHFPQGSKKSREREGRSEFKRRSIGDVGQDNNASERVRIPLQQPYHSDQSARTQPLGINSDRSKKHSTKRRTLPAMGWVTRLISEEIDRIAGREGLTRSKTIKTLLEWAVTEKLHQQTAALIPAVIETS